MQLKSKVNMNWFIMASCYNWFFTLLNHLMAWQQHALLIACYYCSSTTPRICEHFKVTKLERNHTAFMHLWNTALFSSPFFILFNHLYKHSYFVKSTSCPKVMFNLSYLWWDLYLHPICLFFNSLRFIWNVITQITLSLSSLQFFQTPFSKWTFACMLLFLFYFMVSASNDWVS